MQDLSMSEQNEQGTGEHPHESSEDSRLRTKESGHGGHEQHASHCLGSYEDQHASSDSRDLKKRGGKASSHADG